MTGLGGRHAATEERDAMLDAYTKLLLTVIAVALSVIAFRLTVPNASAALGSCGDVPSNPCFVDAASINGLKVRIN